MATKRNPDNGPQNGEQNADPMAAVEEIINAEVDTLRPSQRAFLQLLTELEGMATEDTEPKGFSGDDIAGILLAENESEMWNADDLPRINAKVLSGSQLDIYGFEVKFSDSDEITTGLIAPSSHRKMYLLVHSARLNNAGASALYKLPEPGEEFVWNTSARFIVAKLYKLAKWGKFDNGGSVKARIEGTDLGGAKSVEKLKELETAGFSSTVEPPF